MRQSIFGDRDLGKVRVVPLDNIAETLHAFDHSGAAVYYQVVEFDPSVDQDERHRIAAAVMVELAIPRPPLPWPSDPPEEYPPLDSYSVDIERATFERTTVEKFVGPWYDWSSGRLISPWVGNTRSPSPGAELVTFGYADAFLDPAHGLKATLEEASEWFATINQATFGGFDQELIIYNWSTDWSWFFDAGNEWWGAFCWTIEVPGSQRITAIGASTTD